MKKCSLHLLKANNKGDKGEYDPSVLLKIEDDISTILPNKITQEITLDKRTVKSIHKLKNCINKMYFLRM